MASVESFGSYVYVADGDSGVSVFDVSSDTSVMLTGRIQHLLNMGAAGIYAHDSTLWVSFGGLAVFAYGLAVSPSNPPKLGVSAQTGSFIARQGSYLYTSGLQIHDVSNLSGGDRWAGQFLLGSSRSRVIVSGDYIYYSTTALLDEALVIMRFTGIPRPIVFDTKGPYMVNEGGHLDAHVSAYDPDHWAVSLRVVSLPANSFVISGGSPQTLTIKWDPDFTQAGVYDLEVWAQEASGIDSTLDTVRITVSDRARLVDPPIFDTSGVSAYHVRAALLDGDSLPDVAVTSAVNTLTIFRGNGDGTLSIIASYGTRGDPQQCANADFNGDGDIDLAVSAYASDTLSIYLNNGDGTFGSPIEYFAGDAPRAAAVGDFDGDTAIDLAVSNFSTNDVSVLLNNGAGVLSAAVAYPVGTGPRDVKVADLDGDTDSDLVVANFDSGTFSVLINNGDATLVAAVNYDLGFSVEAIGLPLIDSGSTIDVVGVGSRLGGDYFVAGVAHGLGNGTFQTSLFDLWSVPRNLIHDNLTVIFQLQERF